MRLFRSILVAAVAASVTPAVAQNPWRDSFEGPKTSWRRADSDASYRIDAHRRRNDIAHHGRWCESLRLTAGDGTYVHLVLDVPPAAVIDELTPTLWVRADRAGLQLSARVVLPRTSGRDGQPRSVIVSGTLYNRPGQWQQLRINDVPRQLARQIRVLQGQTEESVDAGQAYVDRLLLNIYRGRGTSNVLIDDLEIVGYVRHEAPTVPAAARIRRLPPADQVDSAGEASPADNRRVQLQGSLLLVDGRPMFPRMIEYQGEPLAWLKTIGINTLRMSHPPSGEMLAEARRQKLWLVCPPPEVSQLLRRQFGRSEQPMIGPAYDVVLAWDLGTGHGGDDLQAIKQRVHQLRLADRRMSRPILCGPASQLLAYSRQVDVLEISRFPLGTSLELSDYLAWLRLRPRLARPGTPVWTTVQTQRLPEHDEQIAALGGGRPVTTATSVDADRLRMLVYATIAAGVRGICFQSRSRLDADDADSRRRARAIELLNLELSLVEPWVAANHHASTGRSNDGQLAATILQHDRAQLVVPVRPMPFAQWIVGQPSRDGISLVLPGVPQSSQAYQLTPTGMPPLARRRVTGGTLVSLDTVDLTPLMVLTQNPQVLRTLHQRLSGMQRRASLLKRDVAADKLALTQSVHQRLETLGQHIPEAAQWLAAAGGHLEQCDQLLDANSRHSGTGAFTSAVRALQPLRRLQRAHWQRAVDRFGSPQSTPLAGGFESLPAWWQFSTYSRTTRWGPDRLIGGDFENLAQMQQAGWTHTAGRPADVQSRVELAAVDQDRGNLSLRMTAVATDAENPPALVESPPLWITSAAVDVRAGELVRIDGRVQVPAAISASVDGLMIVDSIGGEALAARFGQTDGWRQFTLYRVATRSGRWTVGIVLTGLGEAWVDDVTIRSVNAE